MEFNSNLMGLKVNVLFKATDSVYGITAIGTVVYEGTVGLAGHVAVGHGSVDGVHQDLSSLVTGHVGGGDEAIQSVEQARPWAS